MSDTRKISESTHQTRCLLTDVPVVPVLNFGQHSYADTFVAEWQLNLSEPAFPLGLSLCSWSGHIQLSYISNAIDRYTLYPYSYTSSNSAVSKTHWEQYAEWLKENYNPRGPVVEIGCNDGYLIYQFASDNPIVGVDPSTEMCELSRERGIFTINKLFDSVVADEIIKEQGQSALVIANNVLNHANDPVAFCKAVNKLLRKDGVFVFEVPYWLSMMQTDRFPDMVYHEHVSYFTIKSINALLNLAELELVDFEIVNYHGGSIRAVAKKFSSSKVSNKIKQAITEEDQFGLFDPDFYQGKQIAYQQQRDKWLNSFYELKQQNPGAVVIGVGAAAKANTWLTWHGLNSTHLHCITDASERKQGKYTPLTRIPIQSDDEFSKHSQPYALILSWNISEGLKKALLNINPHTRFISQ